MSAQAQTNNGSEEKIFFYYPGYNEQFPRRVLAGLQEGNRIEVSEAVCFPGYKPTVVPVKLRGGRTVYILDPGIRPDAFVKKDGKALAVSRVRGWKDIPHKSGTPKRVFPGKQLIAVINIEGDTVRVNVLSHGNSIANLSKQITGLPVEGLSTGKAFVEGIELYLQHLGFPKKLKKGEEAAETPEPNVAG